ncbi:MAG TPA: FMN-binding protein [Tissierellaceae bacterium]|mgnify:CR=1 FL=1
MKKSFAYPIIFMIVISAIFTFALAFLNQSTAEKIALNQEIELYRKILYIFNIDVPSEKPEDILETFRNNIGTLPYDDTIMYVHYGDNGEILGYAVPISGSGLWGTIEGYVGISSDYTTILGIDFTKQSETPGLGGRISEESFKEQFRGLDITNVIDGNYIIYKPAPGGNVDAIAGATLTSKSVSKIINEDLHSFLKERVRTDG